jgi:hypothetical protein
VTQRNRTNNQIASFSLYDTHREILDRVSEKFSVPRSALVRRLIEVLGEYHKAETEIETKEKQK